MVEELSHSPESVHMKTLLTKYGEVALPLSLALPLALTLTLTLTLVYT